MKHLRCGAGEECRELHKKKNQRELVNDSAEKEKNEEINKKEKCLLRKRITS